MRLIGATAIAVAAALGASEAAAAEGGKMLCCGAKVAMTFGGAAPEIMLLTIALFTAAAASVAVWARALRRLKRAAELSAARPLAFLAAWRVGGPLLGASGAAYLAVNFFVAVYAYPPVARYQAYAPGLAEMSMVLWAGFTAGAVAALAHAHLTGRAAEATEKRMH